VIFFPVKKEKKKKREKEIFFFLHEDLGSRRLYFRMIVKEFGDVGAFGPSDSYRYMVWGLATLPMD